MLVIKIGLPACLPACDDHDDDDDDGATNVISRSFQMKAPTAAAAVTSVALRVRAFNFKPVNVFGV